MSGHKYTPGPWEVCNNTIVHDDKTRIDTLDGKHIGGASIYLSRGIEEAQANANLISAAPELLKELESHCQSCMERNKFENGCPGCFTQRVIKKALGG